MEPEFVAIKKFLDSLHVPYVHYEHEPVHTSKDAARVRGVELKTGVKALLFKSGPHFILVLVPGDSRAVLQKLRALTGEKNLRMATAEEVLKVTNCEIGSVGPFGNLMGLRTFMEKAILANEKVNFNAGLHTVTISMNSRDLKEAVKPVLCDIAKDD